MRIITGSARGIRLETPDGLDTRPTAERVKEAVFSMIQFDIEGRRVLDLFAGSGQMGLEALSRGAAVCTFIDHSPVAINCVKRNAQKTRLFEQCRILSTEWNVFVRNLAKSTQREQFDIVFLDPPYGADLAQTALSRLVEADALADGCLVICETGKDDFPPIPPLTVRRHTRYGKVYITLLEKEASL